jgi:hypothetical protein
MGNAIATMSLPDNFSKIVKNESLWAVVIDNVDSPTYLIGENGRSWLCGADGKTWISKNGGAVWLIGEGGVFEYPWKGTPVQRTLKQIPSNVLDKGDKYVKDYTGAGTAVQTGKLQGVFHEALGSAVVG